MRLGFINLSAKLTHYFAELEPYLQSYDIQPCFFTLNPKVRNMMSRMGVRYFPGRIDKAEDLLSPEKNREILDPVLNLRYRNKSRLYREFARLHYALRNFFESEQIDAVFIWNGTDREGRVAITLAREIGLKTLFGENGYLPDTIQIDPAGINYAASVTRRVAAAIDNVVIDPETYAGLEHRIQLLHSGKPWAVNKPMVKASPWASLVSELRNFSWEKLARSLPGNKGIPESVPLPSRYIFIPFQVEADSQLILYSPLVGQSMDRFLSLCLNAVRQVAPECKLLVKLHPANLGQIDYGPLMKKYPDVLFQKGGSSARLIESSEAVITVNSTVGFEALTYYKPVLTVGESLYNVAGVVYHVKSEGEFAGLLAEALSKPVDRDRINKMLYYLYDNYFGHGSWKNHSANSYQAVADKISQLLSGPY